MKHMKRILALALALMLTLGLATTAFAANITMDDEPVEGAEYAAYQLLTLTTSLKTDNHPEGCTDGKHVDGCYNYAYTVNAKYRAILQAVIGAGTTDDAIIEAISNKDVDGIRAFADGVYAEIQKLAKDEDPQNDVAADYVAASKVFANVNQGYYLIVETETGSAAGFKEDTFSLVMLDTAGQENITVETKEELPQSEKKVQDINDTTGEQLKDGDSVWVDSADHDIGDEVPFQITFTLPSDFAEYEKYYVGIHDVQAAGLTYNNDLKVTVNGDENKVLTNAFTYSAVSDCKNGCTFHITCADIIAAAKAKGIALTAGDKIVFEYTSILNSDAVLGSTGNPNEMTIEFSNNPYGDGTSETPKDRVIVFTYKVNVDKVDKEKNPLTGAEFTLYKEVPAGTENAQTGEQIKKTLAENVKDDALADDKSYIVITKTATASDGDTFGFKGVDDGNYVLVETTIPAGYNAWDAVAFTITAEHDVTADDPQLISLSGGDLFTGEVETEGEEENKNIDGILDTDIVNNAGVELPSTGGIGTTIFYVVGGLLAVAAVVLLVTKKRMNTAE